ncbi:MAG: Mpo1-like protein [Pyrinomonadaceae bacterium]
MNAQNWYSTDCTLFTAFFIAIFIKGFWILPLSMFVFGWILQFVGHYFEGKPPEFFRDWRFLFVGLRWWLKKTFNKQ